MMKKTVGYILISIWVSLALTYLGADALGIGLPAGFGWHQVAGTILGASIALVGIWMAIRQPKFEQKD